MQYVEIKISELIGKPLDWAVAKCEYPDQTVWIYKGAIWFDPFGVFNPSVNPVQGYPIIERENITIIRANDEYVSGKRIPNWFAETDKCVGHSVTTSCNHEQFDPCFMISEEGGYYGSTLLVAAMRAYVGSKFGDVVKIPQELLQ